jgi:spermidine/putrescine transport system substrate-binding protein
LDLSKIKTSLFIRSMLDATKKNTSLGGKVYGVPHTWGTDGLVVNTGTANHISDYKDLCARGLEGKTSVRAKRPTLIAFAFAEGLDPFAAYGNLRDYAALMERVGATLRACRRNIKFFWDDKKEVLRALRSGEIDAAMAWDTGGWALNAENPAIRFIAPKSGALGWVDTFAIPARGANDDAAYRWINFNMRPEIASKVATSSGNVTASRGADTLMADSVKDRFAESFPRATIENIKWYPAVPAGVEEIEAKVLDRLKTDP